MFARLTLNSSAHTLTGEPAPVALALLEVEQALEVVLEGKVQGLR